MKKLLNISVIAALAVLPMAANAEAGDPTGLAANEQASLAAMDAPYGLVDSDATDSNLATAGYVKGAYNSAMMAVNKVANTAANASNTAKSAIEGKLTGEAANGYDINAKTLDVNGDTTVGGNATVTGTLGVTGATTLSSATVSGTLSAGATTLSSASVTGNETVGGTLEVTGATTLSSASVTGNETVGGTLGVTGDTTLNNVTVNSGKTVTASGATVTGTAQNNVAVQYATLTNATIDVDNNSISNIETDNFKSTAIATSISANATDAVNTKLATERAVADAIAGVNGTANGLNTRLTTAEGEIDDIQGTELPVMGSWGSTTVTYNTIADYTTATAARVSGE